MAADRHTPAAPGVLSDNNPASVVGVPWNENGYAGDTDRGCPVCGAPAGDFCHTPAGKPRSDHAGREYEEGDFDA